MEVISKTLGKKNILKIINEQYDCCPQPISHYLNIMKLIFAIEFETEKQLFESDDLTDMIVRALNSYGNYNTDLRNVNRNVFTTLNMP